MLSLVAGVKTRFARVGQDCTSPVFTGICRRYFGRSRFVAMSLADTSCEVAVFP